MTTFFESHKDIFKALTAGITLYLVESTQPAKLLDNPEIAQKRRAKSGDDAEVLIVWNQAAQIPCPLAYTYFV